MTTVLCGLAGVLFYIIMNVNSPFDGHTPSQKFIQIMVNDLNCMTLWSLNLK